LVNKDDHNVRKILSPVPFRF